MYGAVTGDIIGSPYRAADAEDRFFELAKGVRGWSHGREVTFHPKVTAVSVMMMAVAKWMIQDDRRYSSRLAAALQESCRMYPDSGLSPFMSRWMDYENPRPSSRDESSALWCVIPAAEAAKTLPEAISAARQIAQVITKDSRAQECCSALAQALWMASHGRSKEDISFAMHNDFNIRVDVSEEEMKSRLAGCIQQPIIVNGEEIGEYCFHQVGGIARDSETILTGALNAFLKAEGFEDGVRRAVALGGASNAVSAITGALSEAFHGKVPEKIKGACATYIPAEFKQRMTSYEAVCLNKAENARAVQKQPDNSFNIIRMPDGSKVFSVPSYRADIISVLKDRFGPDITLMKPADAQSMLREAALQVRTGTYLEAPRHDVRTVYFQDGAIKTSATVQGKGLPPVEDRIASRKDFIEIADYASAVKSELQRSCGYHGEGSIHFENAYFPVVLSDKVEVWKGDMFAGSVGIDPTSGLLKISQGGDFGPMEYFGPRTESVFNSVNMDSIKQSLGRYCLDEGIGIYDRNRTSNIETANADVSKSKDSSLLSSIEALSSKPSPAIKK